MPKKIGLLGSAANAVRNIFRARITPPKLPPKSPGLGHRGIAAGDLVERQRRMQAGEEPYTAEEIGKWRTLPAGASDDFIWEGIPLYVHSSNVSDATYHHETQEMDVGFLNGDRYRYRSVTVDEAIQFAQAQSKGDWIWSVCRVRGSATAHRKPYTKIA